MTDEPTRFEHLELEWRRANRLWWLVAAALAWIVLEREVPQIGEPTA